MSNYYINTIINKEIIGFIDAYSNWAPALYKGRETNTLHPGEYGTYREILIRELLKNIIPGQFKVGEGFILNPNDEAGDVSTQCDVIIYADSYTPFIDKGYENFFPVETVVSIGEVKSDLTFSTLTAALVKLAKNKKIRKLNYKPTYLKRFPLDQHFENEQDEYTKIIQDLNSKSPLDQSDTRKLEYAKKFLEMYKRIRLNSNKYDISSFHVDHIFSFLICNRITEFNFDNLTEEINKEYEKAGIEKIHRHNMILSVHDGLILYIDPLNSKEVNKIYFPFPKKWEMDLKNCFIPSNKDNVSNIANIIGSVLRKYSLTKKSTNIDKVKPKIMIELSQKLKEYLEENLKVEMVEDEINKIIEKVFLIYNDSIKTGKDFGKILDKVARDFANAIAIIEEIPPYFNDPLEHIKIFCHYFFLSLTDTTILYPELSQYLEDIRFNKDTKIEDN